MRIAATLLLCSSSGALAEQNVIWHAAQGVSRFLVVLHQPDVALQATMDKLSQSYDISTMTVRDDMSHELHVSLVNGMIDELRGYDWVLNLDDDEFYVSPWQIAAVLECVSDAFTHVYVSGFCFYQTTPDPSVLSMIYRDPDGTEYLYSKPIIRPRNFKCTYPGNHFVDLYIPTVRSPRPPMMR